MMGDLFDVTSEGSSSYTLIDKYKLASRTVVDERSKVGFVGLFNQGATCYLNSLIQALYMTPELRKGIYNLTKEELGLEADEKALREEQPQEKPKKQKVEDEDNKEEEEWADQITELIEMGFSRRVAIIALKTTKENGVISINQAIDWLFIPGNSDEPPEDDEKNKEEKKEDQEADQSLISDHSSDQKPKKLRKKRRKIPIELQLLFSELQLVDKFAVSTSRLTESFGWSGKDIGQQHDVHELNRVLFDAIEASLKKTKSEDLLNKLYRGTLVNKVQCLTCGRVSEREESFQDVTVMVSKLTSLKYSLQHFVVPENLDGDNQYYCERCEGKRDAKRWVCFRQLPSILIFSLSRFEYDFDNDRRVKNCNHFHYPLSIDMAPYHEISNSDHTSTSSSSSSSSQSSFDIENMTPAHSLSLFDPSSSNCPPDQLYDLFGVIIHTGNSGEYGHYHAYIKDLTHQGQWSPFPTSPDRRDDDEDDRDGDIDHNSDSVSLHEINSPPSSSSSDSHSTATSSSDNTYTSNSTSTSTATLDGKGGAEDAKDNSIKKNKKSKGEVLDDTEHDKNDWYDFNDSNVTPISLNKLRKQFGGKTECAYMLVYRHRSLDNQSKNDIQVPDHLLDFVQQENERVKVEREEWARLENQIRIHVYAGDHFFVDEDGIARAVPLDSTQSLDSIDTKISFNIDQRLYSSYIKQNIKIMMNEDYLRGCEEVEMMQLLPITINKDGVLITSGSALDENKSMKESSITNGDALLVWNGFHINRSEWNPSNRLISVDLKYISINSDPSILVSNHDANGENKERKEGDEEEEDFSKIPIDINTFQLEIATCTTIKKFKEQLSELTSIPPQYQLLSIVSKKDPTISSFDCGDDDDNHLITIVHDLEAEGSLSSFANYSYLLESKIIGAEAFLSVERISEQRSIDLSSLSPSQRDEKCQEISLVGKFLQIQKTRIQLFILDQISLPPQTLYFLLEKSTTLFELKMKALMQIGSQLDPDQTRLRRTSVNYQGLYRNEDISIDDAGITNFCKIILEEGESPSSRTITVKFKLHLTKEVFPITVNRNWTVQQMKVTMMEKLGIEAGTEYRLRRTDFWGHPTSIIDDDKLLLSSGVNSDDLFVLEAGKVPLKGQFLLNLKLFEYSFPNDFSSSSDLPLPSANDLLTPPSDILSSDLVVDEEKKEEKKEGDEEEKKKGKGRKWKLFSPSIVLAATVPDSYKITDLNSLTISSSATLADLKLTLFQLYPSELTAKTEKHIRIWTRSHVLRDNNEILRNYYIGNNSQLIIQITDEVDQSKGMKETSLLYVFTRKNKQYTKPIEYLFNNTLRFEKSLFDCISDDFSIPKEYLIVGKYFPFTHNWQVIDTDDEEEEDQNPSPSPSSSDSSPVSDVPQTTSPNGELPSVDPKNDKPKKKGTFYFKDGDIIAIQDKRTDPNGDKFMSQVVNVTPNFKSSVKYPTSSSSQKRPEAELKIHVDDYDCEYEDEYEDQIPNDTQN